MSSNEASSWKQEKCEMCRNLSWCKVNCLDWLPAGDGVNEKHNRDVTILTMMLHFLVRYNLINPGGWGWGTGILVLHRNAA